ncbi:MAG: hypothetical protein SGBAC_011305 [Bacillariaceae sp.]
MEGGDAKRPNIFLKDVAKFKARPGANMIIPVIAAIVGWFTNYLAVQMISYPIQFEGIPFYPTTRSPLEILGLTMAFTIVEMVTSPLLTVQDIVARLNPKELAELLSTRVGLLGSDEP